MPPQRSISRILIANRGEIAVRILQSCRELPNTPITYALYTDDDSTHISLGRPHEALRVPSPASYMDIDYLVRLVKEQNIDAVHPGYGFLSESAEFSWRMWSEANAIVVGPGWEVLERTGDKLKAKALAQECEVPVLKAMLRPTSSVEDVRRFTREVGLPIMVKAVDGGGGRGIRLVEKEDQLQNAVERCIGESPSKAVFAEQAAVHGFKHIEVQILGDGRGGIKHLWERDCSIQRRFQKIVEVAPAPVSRRRIIAKVIESAVRMARRLKYLGLGTWEYLVNVNKRQFFFLEINPRLQVEHTITECLTGVDLVREQLFYAQGLQNREDIRLGEWWEADKPPSMSSIQLRLCAEDPNSNFALSIGKVTEINLSSGTGIRVDTHLSRGGVVGSDFDNLMAKIIVSASTWQDCLSKAKRALEEVSVIGVKTNLDLLRAIVADQTFQSGSADTRWLESNTESLIASGEEIKNSIDSATDKLPSLSLASKSSSSSSSQLGSSTLTLRKGDAWSLALASSDSTSSAAHHLELTRVTRNEFPDSLTADITYTIPGSEPQPYKLTLNSTKTSGAAAASSHRRGDPGNKSHIILPLSGKLVEVLVDEGDHVQKNQVVAFVKQMKMEVEVRSAREGTVGWVIELENEDGGGDEVAEGVLIAELLLDDNDDESGEKGIRSKL